MEALCAPPPPPPPPSPPHIHTPVFSWSIYLYSCCTESMAGHQEVLRWQSNLVTQQGVIPWKGCTCVRSNPLATGPSSSARHLQYTYMVSCIYCAVVPYHIYGVHAARVIQYSNTHTHQCTDVLCPTPRPPPHGKQTTMGTIPGSCLHYKCNRGYTLIGTNDRVCLTNGTWTGDTPLCREWV